METQELIEHVKRIRTNNVISTDTTAGYAMLAAILSKYAEPRSTFLEILKTCPPESGDYKVVARHARSVLDGFIDYLEAGLHDEVSPRRRAELDVVSDFLTMAGELLVDENVHPAAPAVVVGATLEEFLRTWVEAEGFSLGDRKPSLDAYAQVLYVERVIKKQDVKDITSWGGTRNHAAHGEWEEVGDTQRVGNMLEGVNLFMRKYGEKRG